MSETQKNERTLALASLFKRINQGEDPKILRKEVYNLAKNVEPEDIAAAEQSLIDIGYSSRVVRQLSATFVLMGLHRRKKGINHRSNLPDNHILQKVMVEHNLARCFLSDLNCVTEEILDLDYISDVNSEFRKLVHIVAHLAAMKEHIEREEDIIFPYLTKQGWIGLCRSAQNDHSKIRIDIDNLVALINCFNRVRLEDFKACLIAIVQRLGPTMLEHFSYEDDLLCPVALVIIEDVKVWEKIKILCDEIGYCGSHI